MAGKVLMKCLYEALYIWNNLWNIAAKGVFGFNGFNSMKTSESFNRWLEQANTAKYNTVKKYEIIYFKYIEYTLKLLKGKQK